MGEGKNRNLVVRSPRPSPVYPQGPLDAILESAARSHPWRVALYAGDVKLDYAELDETATRCAQVVRDLVADTGCVVALTSLLDPAFAVAYYGIVRSGNVVAPVNPLLREPELEYVLASSRARAALVSADVYERLRSIRHRLHYLRTVVLIGPGPTEVGDDVLVLDDLLAAAAGTCDFRQKTDPDAVACIQFTSGTTGLPKAVMLTHRNLTVNAAQVAAAHCLTGTSVSLNYLPTFHSMHLNSAIYAGATQVLCTSPDVADSVTLANRHGATHYYSLPVRLARLAADERLPDLKFETITMIASGGSALPANAAMRLSRHFGVPVFQGYGLAETSPLTHSDDPSHPKLSSVGPPVADTECRVVDVESRKALPAGEIGEVQVRGPQVMKGYLNGEESGIDADGWLSTGDVGYLDDDGCLFLVDRIKDVFKCDNWLVAPSEIERILEQHPAVRECVVVDYPDPYSGAVAAAFVVLRGGTGEGVLDELVAFVNDQVPYYKQLRHVELVDAIPRSPNGKIQRKDLRARMIALRGRR